MAFHFDHLNITVVSIERAREFLSTAFPHFRVRGGSQGTYNGMQTAWEHFGTDEEHFSLNQTSEVQVTARNGSKESGINHTGFVVYDLATLRDRYAAAGYHLTYMEEPPARLRMYVTDKDNIMWEFIQYLSDDPGVQNDNGV